MENFMQIIILIGFSFMHQNYKWWPIKTFVSIETMMLHKKKSNFEQYQENTQCLELLLKKSKRIIIQVTSLQNHEYMEYMCIIVKSQNLH